ncbi:anthrone oxygenase family protein, partial [Streptococcus pneumoniae]|uniref:anthrone oxygenase family protein n=1 Tax=Streptococcus pneumoniae TaxID=1313 RepID=UPI0013DA616A
EPGTAWLILGCLLYIAGTFVVTMVFNVPMNNALEAFPPDGAEAVAYWTRYLIDWTFWNHVRTLAGLASAAVLT